VLGIPDDLIVPFVVIMGYTAQVPRDTPRKLLREIMVEKCRLPD
jgi:hypothetical protein